MKWNGKQIKFFIAKKAPHLFLLALLFFISMLIGAYLPERIPLHWNRGGVVDRIGSKNELIFMLPAAALLVFAISVYAESRFVLPSHKMRGFLSFLQFFFLVIFFVAQTRGLLRAENVWTPFERLLAIPAVLLFAYVGGAFEGAEYMSLFGVKTKWTLQNREVWDRTNRLAARLFRAAAFLMLVSIFFYRWFYYFLVIPPALSIAALFVYSRAISPPPPNNPGGGSGDGGAEK
ncbi:MAG: SdpI family protein [Clostridiales bacterium]|jgi:uncharacterized membrane protein|nr:SdpI family protein [Clostridiales bacterium]